MKQLIIALIIVKKNTDSLVYTQAGINVKDYMNMACGGKMLQVRHERSQLEHEGHLGIIR